MIIFFLFLFVLMIFIALVMPINDKLECRKSNNDCIMIRKYLWGKMTKKISDYSTIVGAEVTQCSDGDGITYNTALVSKSGKKTDIFNVSHSNRAPYRHYADYLNKAFKKKQPKIYLERNNTKMMITVQTILFLIGLSLGTFFPINEELYCSKSLNSCTVTRYYFTWRWNKKIADYNSITGAEVQAVDGENGKTYQVVLIAPKKYIEVFFGSSNLYSKHERDALYLDKEFSNRSPEIRLKRGLIH